MALREEILRKPLNLEYTPEELLAEADSFHLACIHSETLVGCLVLRPESDSRLRMRQFAVRADFQGQGIGRALVTYAEEFARARGYQEIMLHARETAIGFYEKLGYRKEGSRFTEVTIPHFAMRKQLER